MTRKILLLFATAVLSVSFAHASVQVNPRWRTGTLPDLQRTLLARDMNNDGISEAVSLFNGAPFVIGRTGATYGVTWIGPSLTATSLTVKDIDGDGIPEIFTGSSIPSGASTATLAITKYGALTPMRTASIPAEPASLTIANVDDDAAMELVAVTSTTLYVYDAATLTLKWSASGRGGTQVLVTTVDGDAKPEIVVNGNPGYIVDGSSHALKWAYSGGFGSSLTTIDIDHDGRSEFISVMSNGPYVQASLIAWHPDTLATVWSVAGNQYDPIVIADWDGDLQPDLFVFPSNAGNITIRKLTDGTVMKQISPTTYVYAAFAAVADFDGDGTLEMMYSSPNSDRTIRIDDAKTGASEFLSYPIRMNGFAIGDLDQNGTLEYVTADGDSYQGGAALVIHDGRTGATTRKITVSSGSLVPLATGQVDADWQLEIIAMSGLYNTAMYTIFDSNTGAVDGDSGSLPASLTRVLTIRLDPSDSADKVIAALSNGQILILRGATRVIERILTVDSSSASDLALGDYDGDGKTDLVVRTAAAIYVFDLATGAQKTQITGLSPSYYKTSVGAITRTGTAGQVVTSLPAGGGQTLVGYGGIPMTEKWRCTAGTGTQFAFGSTAAGSFAMQVNATAASVWNTAAASPCSTIQTFPQFFASGSNDVRIAELEGKGIADIVAISGNAVEADTLTPVAATHDIDANGKSDVVLQTTSGDVSLWLMNGLSRTDTAVASAAGLQLAGVGDFDGDTRADLLLRNPNTGEVRIWLMNGATRLSDTLAGNPGATYDVAGVGDFNGDGKADILLHDSTGAIGIWLMNGPNITNGALIGSFAGYSVAGVGDFSGDGKADILLGDTHGSIGMWIMNGSVITAGAYVGDVAGDTVGPVADFNGDGKADIVLQDASGGIGVWLMNGPSIASGAYVSSAAGYAIEASGDYDGDGKADLLIRDRNTGSAGIWFMNGTAIASGAYAGSITPQTTMR